MKPPHLPIRSENPDGNFEIDADGRIRDVDANACTMLGVAAGALIGRPLPELLAENQEAPAGVDLARMTDGRLLRTAWRMRRGDGTEFTAEVIGLGIDRNRVRFIARDTTEQEAAETAKARLAAIVESSNDAIVSKTLTGIVTSWNGAAERMFGYTAAEMIGQSIRKLIPTERQSEEDELLGLIGRGERVQDYETVRVHKNGTRIVVALTVSPILSDAGIIVGASKIARDITGRRAAERKLRESDERFRTLADNISQLAWMADATGWIFWYNQRWYDYTGTTLEEMQGWGWKKVHHPDHVDRVVDRIQRSWDTGVHWEDTFPLRGADGEFRWFLSRALPIRDDDGRIVRWFGTNTDITEQKQREEQIRLLMREVNHRSKNMLAVVQAIARQTVATSPENFTERFQERIQALAASQDLFVQSGWRGADIADLVRSQLAHFKDAIGTRIALSGPELVLTSAAAQAIGMVLHELATNAGKYGALSDAQGLVEISWEQRRDQAGDLRFCLEWVESGGPPVTPPSRHGFGSIVIEKMVGASLGAVSELDFAHSGVTWRLECPIGRVIADEVSPAFIKKTVPHRATSSLRRILVVEDDPMVALDMVERLQSADYEVVGPASTLAEAFALASDEDFDCALLDVNLGSETSEAFAERLREQAIPFIALSGYSREQQPPIFHSVPSLSKPVATGDLIAVIEQQCGRH